MAHATDSLRATFSALVAGRLLGGGADPVALTRMVRHGSEAQAVVALGRLGRLPEEKARLFVEERLADERAALRRAAARALALRGEGASLPALHAATDRTDEGSVCLAVARVRCGADRATEAARLAERDRRVYHTEGGVRRTAFDVPPLPERLLLALDQPVDPFDTLNERLRTAGRREQHVLFNALGIGGDPRAFPLLVDALRATDVDPGRGFTQRRLSATAIGRLGLRAATPVLLRALQDEALDFEGRPGAGMGIQYPVRTNLLWALGEVADPAAIPTLISYLGNTSGSAFGGFYLAAMDALYKLGERAAPALRAVLQSGPDTDAAHALGVLVALGEEPTPWRNDRRAGVAGLAKRAALDPSRAIAPAVDRR